MQEDDDVVRNTSAVDLGSGAIWRAPSPMEIGSLFSAIRVDVLCTETSR